MFIRPVFVKSFYYYYYYYYYYCGVVSSNSNVVQCLVLGGPCSVIMVCPQIPDLSIHSRLSLSPLSLCRISGPCSNMVKSNNNSQQVKKYCGKVYFHISNFKSQITYSIVKCGCSLYFVLNSANLICRGTDISKRFKEYLGVRDNKSRLYLFILGYTC